MHTSAHRRELIAVGISNISGVKVGGVMQSQSRRPGAFASVCESSAMEVVNRLPGERGEGDHAAVAYGSRLLIKRFADPKSKLANSAILVGSPARSDPVPFRVSGYAAPHAKR